MVAHYKIMATIIKPGCLPTQWIRYSERRMTEVVCQKLFSLLKESGGIKLVWKIFVVKW